MVEAVSALGDKGVARLLCTAIEVDGTMEGPARGQLSEIAAATDSKIIASGGVGALADLVSLAREAPANIEGVIVGRALYERRFTVAEAISSAWSLRVGRPSLYASPMVLKRVIPCLDVDAGRVVKGTNFLGLRDAGDPVELAERYDAEGADELVFLDITASHENRETIVELARRTADNVFIPFTIGGGIRSVEDAQAVLDAGADKVSVNSAALSRPQLLTELAEHFGAQCVVIAIDAKSEADGWGVYVNGGRKKFEGRDAISWAREAVERGAGEVLLTSMDRDGTSNGYDIELTRAVADAGLGPGDRLRRRRHPGSPECGDHRWWRRRRALRLDLPLPGPPRAGCQAAPRSRRHSGQALGRGRGRRMSAETSKELEGRCNVPSRSWRSSANGQGESRSIWWGRRPRPPPRSRSGRHRSGDRG